MLPEAINVLMLVVEAFDRLHIPYLVGGSMASALHGVTRSTIDANLIAEIEPEQVQALAEMLGDDFYADEEMIVDAVLHRSSFNLIHLKTMLKVDILWIFSFARTALSTRLNSSAGKNRYFQSTRVKKLS